MAIHAICTTGLAFSGVRNNKAIATVTNGAERSIYGLAFPCEVLVLSIRCPTTRFPIITKITEIIGRMAENTPNLDLSVHPSTSE